MSRPIFHSAIAITDANNSPTKGLSALATIGLCIILYALYALFKMYQARNLAYTRGHHHVQGAHNIPSGNDSDEHDGMERYSLRERLRTKDGQAKREYKSHEVREGQEQGSRDSGYGPRTQGAGGQRTRGGGDGGTTLTGWRGERGKTTRSGGGSFSSFSSAPMLMWNRKQRQGGGALGRNEGVECV